jgi:flagellar protein FlaG
MIQEVAGRDALPIIPGSEPAKIADSNAQQSNGGATSAAPNTMPVDRRSLEHAVGKVRDAFQHVDSNLKIEIDPDLHQVVVKIMNAQTGEVIRQIPAQEMLDIAKRLDGVQGLLFTKRT